MPQPPSGTVTFLFTDIEGSTKRWEGHPQAMQAAFARHEAIVRNAVSANSGYAYKMIGDAFQAAFPTALQAAQAALDAQRALRQEPWPDEIGEVRVRMALHSGVTEERGDDYVGSTLNRAARLLSAGHGGQVLLSSSTYELLRDALPASLNLQDMGEHRLKDLIRPEHVYQLHSQDLPSDFPPLVTLDTCPNNLPVQPTAFIGREKELGAVCALLRGGAGARLVTLTGPGGTGKTRLALQVVAELLDAFKDGVWFVDLAPITDPSLVIPTIAQTLGVHESGGEPVAGKLKTYLGDKQLLLLLDSFERVVDAAPQVAQLLAATHIVVLVTSLLPLQLRAEREYPVPPLALPHPAHLPPPDRLAEYEAIRLFVDRAQAVKPDFELNNENAATVAEICLHLDGLPLAIELAAARIRLFPPQAMLARLGSRLQLLTGGPRDLPARQQTLRNAIEWSYDLLTEGERELFRRMAVFSGGRTLEALEAVCGGTAGVSGSPNPVTDPQPLPPLAIDLLEGIASLVNKSLLQQREGLHGEPRFWMLETIHEYAWEKLRESGEAPALQRRHAVYFMELAEDAEKELTGAGQQEWLDRLDEERDNLREALRRSRGTAAAGPGGGEGTSGSDEAGRAVEVGLRLAGALWRFWQVRGLFSEGLEQLAGVLRAADAENQAQGSERRSSLRAKALNGAGNLAQRQGDYAAARSLHEQSLAIRRALGDKQGMAASLNNLGNAAYSHGDYEDARSLFEQSLAIQRELGDKRVLTAALSNLGIVAFRQGDYATARSRYEESLAIDRELGDKFGIASSLSNLGNLADLQGDHVAARSLHEQSLAIQRELGDKQGVASSLSNLGDVAFRQGDYADARSRYEESLAIQRELGDRQGIATSLSQLGAVDTMPEGAGTEDSEQVERAARLLGAAEGVLRATGGILHADEQMRHERALGSTRSKLGHDEFERARAEGQAMSMEEAIEYALRERRARPDARPARRAGTGK